MENISILKSTDLLVFLLFLLPHISIAYSTAPRYVPDNIFLINCGSPGQLPDMDKRMWIGDMEPSKFAPIEERNQKSNTSKAQTQDSSAETVPYMTARLSHSQFTYVFPLTSGPKFVRLYFYAVSYSGFDGSLAFFSVKANSKFTLLRNFSASILANYLDLGDHSKRLSKEFCINVEEDQKLNLTFIPTPSTGSSRFFAFVNGIEIVSMPTYLYYSRPEDQSPPYVGQNNALFSIDNNRALEMVFRLNIGGTSISPTGDTGMFREWSLGAPYLLSGGVNPRQAGLTLKYSVIPNYTAPDDVYRSAISMGPNITWNLHSNLTWGLPVDPWFNYLVRLHFCEIEPEITMAGERPFIIYIDNMTAEGTADVIMWSGGKDTPVYRDYVVMIQKMGVDQDKSTLFIALHPAKATNKIRDAILNGIEVFKLSDSNNSLAGPNPAGTLLPSPPSAQQPASTSNSRKTIIFIAIGIGVGSFLALLSCVAVWKLRTSKRYGSYYPVSKCWFWSDQNKGKSTRTKASSLPEELCRQFSLEEIKTATHNFDEELVIGVGGFGKVYKGLIDDGTMTVAIKRLNPESKQGPKEFWKEIEMLSQLRHVHLVSLIGYSNDEKEMILVYDYMSNGTLREHLYDTDKDPLPWIQRLQICIGAACGLNYLHTGVKHPIIHRDVKTTNILLDENCVAKVADFGLSKEGQDAKAVSTLVKGTFGYLDPDYARRRQLTEKSDVYSFGVVLLEVLCARRALNPRLEEEQWSLAIWARKCIEKGTMGEIIDPNLMGKIAPECFKVYVDIAESCVRDQGSQRPTMNDVMDKLSFALQRQKEADAEKEKVNPDGKEIYTEVLSFHVSDTTETRRDSNIFSGHVSESDSATWLTTDNTGMMTYPSLDSDTVKCEGMFTDTSNVSKA